MKLMLGDKDIDIGLHVSGAEDLDTEMTTQDNLITQIKGALEGKTVPSSGVELEAITLSQANSSTKTYTVKYLSTDGTLKTVELSAGESISDVVKNSICWLQDISSSSIGFTIDEGTAEELKNNYGSSSVAAFLVMIPSTNVTISLYK